MYVIMVTYMTPNTTNFVYALINCSAKKVTIRI